MSVLVKMLKTIGMWEAGKVYALPESLASLLVSNQNARLTAKVEIDAAAASTKTMKPGQVLRGGL